MPHQPGYLIPDVDDATRLCFQVSVPNDPQHIAAFMGQLELLGRWYTWQRDDTQAGKRLAVTWAGIFDEVALRHSRGDFLPGDCSMIDCDALIDCLSGRLRTSANGLQYKNSDGTWTDLPNSQGDPRTDGTVPPGWTSPPAGQSGPCLTGANVAAIFKSNNDKLIAELEGAAEILTGIEIVSALMGLLFPPFEILSVAIAACAGLAFDIGAVALAAALTSDQYDLVKCIIECHTTADGTIGGSDASQMKSDGEIQLNSITSQMFSKFIDTFGPNGLMLMETMAGITAADCSACDVCPWSSLFDFTVDQYAGIWGQTRGEAWLLNAGWVSSSFGGFPVQFYIQASLAATRITELVFQFQADYTAEDASAYGLETSAGNASQVDGIAHGFNEYHLTRDMPGRTFIGMYGNLGHAAAGTLYLRNVFIRGTGNKPAGWP